MDNKIHLRQYAASICDIFEDILDKYDITIPDEDRTGVDGEARLYGMEYAIVENMITDALVRLAKEVASNPDKELEADCY